MIGKFLRSLGFDAHVWIKGRNKGERRCSLCGMIQHRHAKGWSFDGKKKKPGRWETVYHRPGQASCGSH